MALNLDNLDKSAFYNAVEKELYKMFMDIYEEFIRAKERDLNVYGMPHLGSFDLVSRNVERDGLSLINNDNEAGMRYLYKAWNANNPKRGLHFTRTYLQVLFPNNWVLDQLWQEKTKDYPLALSSEKYLPNPDETHYLTSRVVAGVEFNNDPDTRRKIEPALRSTMGIRFLFELQALVRLENEVSLANAQVATKTVSMSDDFTFLIDDKNNAGVANASSSLKITSMSDSFRFVVGEGNELSISNVDNSVNIVILD